MHADGMSGLLSRAPASTLLLNSIASRSLKQLDTTATSRD